MDMSESAWVELPELERNTVPGTVAPNTQTPGAEPASAPPTIRRSPLREIASAALRLAANGTGTRRR